ncbi:MAG: 3-deoxy-8-phosphooctulonate synthase [Chitinophagaceae bacterium]|nr:3-deoxy-8-phosphooctulonate synthase [Chitinophagaceae bacterium]
MEAFLNNLFSKQDYNPRSFFLLAGPCVVESEELIMEVAGELAGISKNLGIPLIFKSSYRKANRTSGQSFTGLGDQVAMEMLQRTGAHYQLPLVTDIHSPEEAALAAKYVDVLQIPAFLCRQTDLLVAAAKTGKIINVKKGQFVSGEAMKFAVEKIRNAGNQQVMLTERGTTFGYQDLVVDYRNIPAMKAHGVPVIMDVTHALQQPNLTSGVTGGNPQLIGTIAKAAIAAGADGIFIETHPNPAKALSDGANMLPLEKMESLMKELMRIREAVV